MSLPTRERELKQEPDADDGAKRTSLPTRERELKHGGNGGVGGVRGSLPTRERELKLRRGIIVGKRAGWLLHRYF